MAEEIGCKNNIILSKIVWLRKLEMYGMAFARTCNTVNQCVTYGTGQWILPTKILYKLPSRDIKLCKHVIMYLQEVVVKRSTACISHY